MCHFLYGLVCTLSGNAKSQHPNNWHCYFTAFVAVATEVAVATAADVMMLLKPLSLAGELP